MLWELHNITCKSKCLTFKFKEKDEVTYCVLSWIPVFIIPSTFMQDITSSFDGVRPT